MTGLEFYEISDPDEIRAELDSIIENTNTVGHRWKLE
jgi:hypothetical protein